MTTITFPRARAFPLYRPRVFPALVFMAVLLLICLFFVWSRLQFTHLEYDISSLEQRQRDLQQESTRLKLEAASLRHPGRIEQAAKSQLGLHLPHPAQVIVID